MKLFSSFLIVLSLSSGDALAVTRKTTSKVSEASKASNSLKKPEFVSLIMEKTGLQKSDVESVRDSLRFKDSLRFNFNSILIFGITGS